MNTLLFVGDDRSQETFRGRVYGGDTKDDPRRAFVHALATTGVVDCPAYDPWVAALQERGWLPLQPELEPNPDGPGRIGRWRLTPAGVEAWKEMGP